MGKTCAYVGYIWKYMVSGPVMRDAASGVRDPGSGVRGKGNEAQE